jgi:glycosyltransferase involved in cell wall biosynthesis
MSKALRELQEAAEGRYRFLYIFIDDGSSDQTWTILQDLFGSDPRVTLLRHEINQGITAAILTGARAAQTELVCSLDCDCTYDPMDLRHLLPLATSDVDCVTASPYHPDGKVLNVSAWRRVISRGASTLYQIVLGSELHTFTGCFRVYRRNRLLALAVRESGFVGIAEIIGKLQLEGARIVEYPATLAVRMLGRSKMKLVASMLRHLRLLSSLAWSRYLSSRRPNAPDTLVAPVSQRKGLS